MIGRDYRIKANLEVILLIGIEHPDPMGSYLQHWTVPFFMEMKRASFAADTPS